MTRSRVDSMGFLLLGSAAFLLFGFLQSRVGFPLMDFRIVYYSAQCLLHHCDPYSQSDVLRLYAQHADISSASPTDRLVLGGNPYLPTEFSFTFLFGLLPFGPAQLLWFVLIAGGAILGHLRRGIFRQTTPGNCTSCFASVLPTADQLFILAIQRV